jgi:hypothetical protein
MDSRPTRKQSSDPICPVVSWTYSRSPWNCPNASRVLKRFLGFFCCMHGPTKYQKGSPLFPDKTGSPPTRESDLRVLLVESFLGAPI